MKILLVLSEMPRMPGSGGASRSFCLIRELSRKHAFTVLTSEEVFKHRARDLESLGVAVEVVPQGPGDEGPFVFRSLARNHYTIALDSILFQQPELIRRFRGVRARMARRIEERLADGFDLLQVDHSWSAQWIEGLRIEVPKVIILYDVVSLLYRRIYEKKRLKMERLEAFFAWRKMMRYEKRAIRQFDRCVVLSRNDLEALRALVPDCEAAIVPNGVDAGYFTPQESLPEEPGSLVFTGAMCWYPNEDAMLWFGGEVLPLIRMRHPRARLSIVGADPRPPVAALHDGEKIVVTGYVEDVRRYIARSALCVAPIRVGSGTRIKILEAMAMGKAVVSTSIGCEGLDVTDGENILVADSPEDFAACVCRLLEDPALARSLGRSGRRLIEEKYSYGFLAGRMDRVYEEVVSAAGKRGSRV